MMILIDPSTLPYVYFRTSFIGLLASKDFIG